jgi:hypothetical protein
MAAAVNRDGVLGVTWADFGQTQNCYYVVFAASVDGGEAFLPEERFSDAPSCPDDTVIGGRVPWIDGGAYWGMATDNTGRFQFLWSDAREGLLQLRTCSAEIVHP